MNAPNTREGPTKASLASVPGHRGQQGNVKADELALAGSSADKDPMHSIGIANMVVKETIKQFKDRSQDRWKGIPSHKPRSFWLDTGLLLQWTY
ncbi:hypothetical protein Trydic_g13737 [Trypoxylus dichotomus]